MVNVWEAELYSTSDASLAWLWGVDSDNGDISFGWNLNFWFRDFGAYPRGFLLYDYNDYNDGDNIQPLPKNWENVT